MKRVALLFVLTGFVFAASAQKVKSHENQRPQIQHKFFGCVLGSSYGSVKSGLESQYKSYDIITGKRKIDLFHASFGGYEWYSSTFVFDRSNKFYRISFQQNFSKKEEAYNLYSQLEKKLEYKYGKGIDITDDAMEKTLSWCDNTCCAILSLSYGASKGGDYYWYCTLYYYDDKKFTSELKSAMDEL